MTDAVPGPIAESALLAPIRDERLGQAARYRGPLASLWRNDVTPLSPTARASAGPTASRTSKWIAWALAMIRVVQLYPALSALATAFGGRTLDMMTACASVEVLWSVLLFTLLLSGRITRMGIFAAIDGGLALFCVVMVGRSLAPEQVMTTHNWAVAVAIAAAMLVMLTVGAAAGSATAAGLVIAYAASVWKSGAPYELDAALLNIANLLGYTATARIVASRLFQSAAETDRATVALAEMERQEERNRQYLYVHDTALQTLSVIAKGTASISDAAVRRRCARDADALRSYFKTGSPAVEPTDALSLALQQVIERQAAVGLYVRDDVRNLPASLSPPVVAALSMAASAAMDNVVKHADTLEVRLTAVGTPGGAVEVTVVDGGRGFDLKAVKVPGGLRHSIMDRMTGIGGKAMVFSTPGTGTTVHLVWPA